MTKVVVRTEDVASFFSRARDTARRADQGEAFEGKATLSFEDPQRMFTFLSEARRRLMLEVMHETRSAESAESGSDTITPHLAAIPARLDPPRSATRSKEGLRRTLGLPVTSH